MECGMSRQRAGKKIGRKREKEDALTTYLTFYPSLFFLLTFLYTILIIWILGKGLSTDYICLVVWLQITDEPYTQAKVSKVETEDAKEQPCKYFDSFLLPLAPNWVTITTTFMQPFVFREDTLKVSWESLKLRKVSKKLTTLQRVPRFHSKLETPSCSKGRGECVA